MTFPRDPQTGALDLAVFDRLTNPTARTAAIMDLKQNGTAEEKNTFIKHSQEILQQNEAARIQNNARKEAAQAELVVAEKQVAIINSQIATKIAKEITQGTPHKSKGCSIS